MPLSRGSMKYSSKSVRIIPAWETHRMRQKCQLLWKRGKIYTTFVFKECPLFHFCFFKVRKIRWTGRTQNVILIWDKSRDTAHLFQSTNPNICLIHCLQGSGKDTIFKQDPNACAKRTSSANYSLKTLALRYSVLLPRWNENLKKVHFPK